MITFIEAILLVVFPAMITAGAVLIYRDWQIPDTWISDIKGEIEACRDELDSDEYHLAPIPMNAWKDESEEEKRKTLKVRYQKVKEFYDELISRNERIRGLTMMQKTDVKAVNESTRHKARLALNALK